MPLALVEQFGDFGFKSIVAVVGVGPEKKTVMPSVDRETYAAGMPW